MHTHAHTHRDARKCMCACERKCLVYVCRGECMSAMCVFAKGGGRVGWGEGEGGEGEGKEERKTRGVAG